MTDDMMNRRTLVVKTPWRRSLRYMMSFAAKQRMDGWWTAPQAVRGAKGVATVKFLGFGR